jgi:sporulation protein YabP
MEIVKSLTEKPKMVKDHKVILDNRKKISLTGINKAISANETSIVLELSNGKVVINGAQLHISKLDVEQGVVEIDGTINSLKYFGTGDQQTFFKRIFK